MSVCAICHRTTQGDADCPRCKHPDHLIEAKFNKHDGKAPTKRGQGDPNATYKWPKFEKGTAPQKPPGA